MVDALTAFTFFVSGASHSPFTFIVVHYHLHGSYRFIMHTRIEFISRLIGAVVLAAALAIVGVQLATMFNLDPLRSFQ